MSLAPGRALCVTHGGYRRLGDGYKLPCVPILWHDALYHLWPVLIYTCTVLYLVLPSGCAPQAVALMLTPPLHEHNCRIYPGTRCIVSMARLLWREPQCLELCLYDHIAE